MAGGLVEITGQRWKVLAYADVVGSIPQDGEMYVLSGVPNFEAPRVSVMGDGIHTVAELVAMRQYRPVYAYADVSADTPEAGAQVALIGAPNTSLYVLVVTGDGTHTIADLVLNSAEDVQTRMVGLVEIDDDYTVEEGVHTIIVTADADIDISIPDGFFVGKPLAISKSVAGTHQVRAVMLGDETIEGAASFVTHGAFAASTSNNAEVTLRKKTSGGWNHVNGFVRGGGANTTWERTPGRLVQRGWGYFQGDGTPVANITITYPIAFASINNNRADSGGVKAVADGVPTNPMNALAGIIPVSTSMHTNGIANPLTQGKIYITSTDNISGSYNVIYTWEVSGK